MYKWYNLYILILWSRSKMTGATWSWKFHFIGNLKVQRFVTSLLQKIYHFLRDLLSASSGRYQISKKFHILASLTLSRGDLLRIYELSSLSAKNIKSFDQNDSVSIYPSIFLINVAWVQRKVSEIGLDFAIECTLLYKRRFAQKSWAEN